MSEGCESLIPTRDILHCTLSHPEPVTVARISRAKWKRYWRVLPFFVASQRDLIERWLIVVTDEIIRERVVEVMVTLLAGVSDFGMHDAEVVRLGRGEDLGLGRDRVGRRGAADGAVDALGGVPVLAVQFPVVQLRLLVRAGFSVDAVLDFPRP